MVCTVSDSVNHSEQSLQLIQNELGSIPCHLKHKFSVQNFVVINRILKKEHKIRVAVKVQIAEIITSDVLLIRAFSSRHHG